ncbi:MAG: 23S rRNA (uridine(2552)-2'-O)-methyltransferase RlmE [Gammaproteobacteria bacterium]|nr:23S rRNA (uridine(2552)-2'-O)-methyltransferase RlmE [Gammaproteobacteria bacterium]
MKRSKTSGRWLQEHFSDEFVLRSQKEGYRSRAVYKLIEIDEKDRLLKPGMTVVELGAAPGGWTQYLSMKLGDKGTVIASDILEMDPFADVTFIHGDFTQENVYEKLLDAIDGRPVDLVLSDMAPNFSGTKAVDQPKSMYLAELALDLASQVLRPGGSFLTKLFQGEGFEPYLKSTRERYNTVKSRKPKASRDRSREIYLLASGFKG